MSDLEKFLHNDELPIPHLIRIGIAHYQFETIHSFLDGNGRLGRLLITLYLVSNNIINKPALCLSDFFERNRQHYYDNLTIVRTKNQMIQWLKLFLVGVMETAQNSIDTFNAIISLRQDVEEKKIMQLGKRVPFAMELIKYLYSKPIVDANEIATALSGVKLRKMVVNPVKICNIKTYICLSLIAIYYRLLSFEKVKIPIFLQQPKLLLKN